MGAPARTTVSWRPSETSLARGATYDDLYSSFRWSVPDRLNISAQVCDNWAIADPGRTAIIDLSDGMPQNVTYRDLWALSRRVQAVLEAQGVTPGDRVGVLLSQSALLAAAHIAAWRMGAISVPLFTLFQRDALASRLDDSGANVVVTDNRGVEMLAPFDLTALTEADLPITTQAAPAFETTPETPAVLIYTSGTTGKPKGSGITPGSLI